jgi:hypothetical protein
VDVGVAPLVRAVVNRIQAQLGDELVAAYLYGSAATGGFDPDASDIDLVALVRVPIPEVDLDGLQRMHVEFADLNPAWLDRIEVVYVSAPGLATFRSDPGPLAVVSPGEPFHVRSEPLCAWCQNWYLVRETGITMFGPSPHITVPEVSWGEFLSATADYGAEIAGRDLSAADPGALSYAVLTMCRGLRTLRLNVLGSKQEAAAWAMERMPDWAWLIEAALRCRLSRGRSGFRDDETRRAAGRFVGLLGRELATIGRE